MNPFSFSLFLGSSVMALSLMARADSCASCLSGASDCAHNDACQPKAACCSLAEDSTQADRAEADSTQAQAESQTAQETISPEQPALTPEQQAEALHHQYSEAISLIATREGEKMTQGLSKLEALVAQQYPPAMDSLAYCIGTGLGIEANVEKGFALYEKAALLGYTPSIKSLAECYIEGIGTQKNVARGHQLYMKLWEMGEYSIASSIANIYAKGLYGVPDPISAAAWYHSGAKKRDLICVRHYATCLQSGEGIERDEKAAYEIFKSLADNEEDPYAMAKLGLMCWHGRVVEKDKEQAIGYFRKGAARGSADARRYLAYAYRDGQGVKQNPAIAASMLRDLAEDGSVIAQYDIAMMLKDGYGVEQDLTSAYKFFSAAAKEGYNPALYQVGMARLLGKGCKKEPESAIAVLEQCRQLGSPDAAIALALCQREGLGMPQNQAQAHASLMNLAERQCPGVHYEIGIDYEQGMGVQADAAKAKEYFEKAAAEGDTRAKEKIKSHQTGH